MPCCSADEGVLCEAKWFGIGSYGELRRSLEGFALLRCETCWSEYGSPIPV